MNQLIPEELIPRPRHYVPPVCGKDDNEEVVSDVLSEKVFGNYLIVKTILKNLRWQERKVSKAVNKLWAQVARSLELEQLWPCDFTMHIWTSLSQSRKRGHRPVQQQPGLIEMHINQYLCNAPLCVLQFGNDRACYTPYFCSQFKDPPCDPPCHFQHFLMDVAYVDFVYPRDYMLSILCTQMIYMPPAQATTAPFTMDRRLCVALQRNKTLPFASGVCIPQVPHVQCHRVTYDIPDHELFVEIMQDFKLKLDAVGNDETIKGVLFFLNETYLMYDDDTLEFFHDFWVRNRPFAFGGCLVVDTNSWGKLEVSGRMTALVFTVPNDFDIIKRPYLNFEIFSLVIEQKTWTKSAIQKEIEDFAKAIPKFEYSTVFKLSCIGRDSHHEIEQNLFREAFPDTLIIGCYGNGEFGVNHPPKSSHKTRNTQDKFTFSYSYSTVFVFFGWGKILT